VHFGTVLTPYRVDPGVRPSRRVTSNQARACLDPVDERWCGNVRGFDMRFNFFHASGSTDYPRWQGYFRSGYTTGRIDFQPHDPATGYEQGEARSLSYLTVPLFLGGHVYLFKRSPVRPYGGMGFGFDVLKVQYAREKERPRNDVSARIGFELHAGIEARITNWVTVNAEVMQLWSARRKLPGVPDFSNEGLTFMVGVGVNFPTWGGHHHVEKVRRVKKVQRPTRVRVEVREAPEEEAPAERNPMPAAAEPAPPLEAAPQPVAPEPAPVEALPEAAPPPPEPIAAPPPG
jgi:opacity protein-like surface antigen